jgi:hypothetical protein
VTQTKKRKLAHLHCFALLWLFVAPSLFAQTCPRGAIDKTALIDKVKHAGGTDVIFRSVAIAGDVLVPALQGLSEPAMRGAVQVSLAKLGDKSALEQLKRELNDTKSADTALDKLVHVGTDAAISILMDFLVAHMSDDSMHHSFGDYSTDLRLRLIEVVSQRLQIGPIAPNGNFSVSLQDWEAWWNQNKGKPIALSIGPGLHDPYLQCLARKVEWGFPDAIFDLANSRDPQVVPIFKKLAEFGDHSGRSFNLMTIRGRAEFGLAKMGDLEEFNAIKNELDRAGYTGAIEELRLLGGRDAVAALIKAFDSPHFLPEYRGFKWTYQRELNRRNQEIQSALFKMVVSPPETKITPYGEKIWKDWWAKNKDTAKFVVPPAVAHE